jgi:hypothetical protein
MVNMEIKIEHLHGGTVGDVRSFTTGDVKAVWKTQKKWERPGDPESWRREYDLYTSGFDSLFTGALRWPKCYHTEMKDDEWQIWMEYIGGASGYDLTGGMYEKAALELGRFQGKLYAEQPAILQTLTNLSKSEDMKLFYRHYRGWSEVYDYIRSDGCGIPKHLCQMIIDMDAKSDEAWRRIEELPVVFCHRDFWVTNIFYTESEIILIDWDTSGWGHIGEDIVSLIADEADVENMVKYYHTCVPAYIKGFSEFADISHIPDLYIYERIIMHFGYRIVEWFKFADTPEKKEYNLNTLQKIYEMRNKP